jgi:polyribonucleotide nucleotidyltransferase
LPFFVLIKKRQRMIVTKTFDLGDGRQIPIETGKLAKQADGSVVVKMGNTMLLATVCSKKEAAEEEPKEEAKQ